jgi:hypothetical protein
LGSFVGYEVYYLIRCKFIVYVDWDVYICEFWVSNVKDHKEVIHDKGIRLKAYEMKQGLSLLVNMESLDGGFESMTLLFQA